MSPEEADDWRRTAQFWSGAGLLAASAGGVTADFGTGLAVFGIVLGIGYLWSAFQKP